MFYFILNEERQINCFLILKNSSYFKIFTASRFVLSYVIGRNEKMVQLQWRGLGQYLIQLQTLLASGLAVPFSKLDVKDTSPTIT